MRLNKKIAIICVLIAVVSIGIAATEPPEKKPKRNLKVLPKDISKEDLDKVMHGFNDALGVKCNFCHAGGPDANGQFKMDFASDEKGEKGVARQMFKMTNKINRKFFKYRPDKTTDALPPVTCMTCHNGKPHPEGIKK